MLYKVPIARVASLTLAAALVLGACGGRSDFKFLRGAGGEEPAVDGSATSGAPGTSGAGGSSGEAGSSGAGGGIGGAGTSGGGAGGILDSGRPDVEAGAACTVQDAGVDCPSNRCSLLSGIVVSNPAVFDDRTDGLVSPGEGATLSVLFTETAGRNVSCQSLAVVFTPNRPDVVISYDGLPHFLSACRGLEMQAHATFGTAIPPGTTIYITARAALAGLSCTNGSSITFSVTVR